MGVLKEIKSILEEGKAAEHSQQIQDDFMHEASKAMETEDLLPVLKMHSPLKLSITINRIVKLLAEGG